MRSGKVVEAPRAGSFEVAGAHRKGTRAVVVGSGPAGLYAALVLGLIQAATYLIVGLVAGAQVEAGLPGVLVLIALAIVISLAFGAVGLAVGSVPSIRG